MSDSAMGPFRPYGSPIPDPNAEEAALRPLDEALGTR